MNDPGLNYGEKISMEDKNVLRAFTIEMVLATDMKKHFGLVSQFQVRSCLATALSMRQWTASQRQRDQSLSGTDA